MSIIIAPYCFNNSIIIFWLTTLISVTCRQVHPTSPLHGYAVALSITTLCWLVVLVHNSIRMLLWKNTKMASLLFVSLWSFSTVHVLMYIIISSMLMAISFQRYLRTYLRTCMFVCLSVCSPLHATSRYGLRHIATSHSCSFHEWIVIHNLFFCFWAIDVCWDWNMRFSASLILMFWTSKCSK